MNSEKTQVETSVKDQTQIDTTKKNSKLHIEMTHRKKVVLFVAYAAFAILLLVNLR